MKSEVLLSQARKHLWAAWALSAEELASQAAATLLGLGMLVPEGGAAELERLRVRVAELETERHSTNEALSDAAEQLRANQDRTAEQAATRAAVLDDFIARCEVALSGCCSECDAATAIVKGRKQAALDSASVPEWSVDKLTRLLAPTQALREDEPETDSLPAWLYRRFMPDGEGWDRLDSDQREYWEHQARAVGRAVARGGFKPVTGGA